tara:strand:- start:153 stop:362 length:210 start_codon:yes stop_codon:yes gene_type:complete
MQAGSSQTADHPHEKAAPETPSRVHAEELEAAEEREAIHGPKRRPPKKKSISLVDRLEAQAPTPKRSNL